MKKTISAVLALAMVLSMGGCLKKDDTPDALSLMQEINSSNVISEDANSRVWYEINPSMYPEGTAFKTLASQLGYLSDGNISTTDDLNLAGILLTDTIAEDDSFSIINYQSVDETLGTQDDVAALCTQANAVNLPVMIRLDLRTLSKSNTDFQNLCAAIESLQEGQTLDDVDPNLTGMFFIGQDIHEDNWLQIGSTNYYYAALPQSDAPMINQDSDYWKSQVLAGIDYWLSLGVSGFYLDSYHEYYPGNDQSNTDFVNWITDQIKQRKSDAYVVVSYSGWNDTMSQAQASLSDEGWSGADGMVAKTVTGAIPATELGSYLQQISERSAVLPSSFLNSLDGSLDLLKSTSREDQYKMALAVSILMSGQVFLACGDELGLTSSQTSAMTSQIETSVDGSTEADEDVDLEFGSLKEQSEDGDSILNFVKQAILLRDSYMALSAGKISMNESMSSDHVLYLDKQTDTTHTVVIFNFDSEPQTVDLSSIQISGLPAEIGGVLLTGDETISYTDSQLTLPAYSVVILK